jgi:hypothetical protein
VIIKNVPLKFITRRQGDQGEGELSIVNCEWLIVNGLLGGEAQNMHDGHMNELNIDPSQ